MDQPDRRRILSPVDLAAITEAVKSANHADSCRFTDITPAELAECVKFYRNWNEVFESSKKTVRNTLLVLIITAGFGVMAVGFWIKKS